MVVLEDIFMKDIWKKTMFRKYIEDRILEKLKGENERKMSEKIGGPFVVMWMKDKYILLSVFSENGEKREIKVITAYVGEALSDISFDFNEPNSVDCFLLLKEYILEHEVK